MKELKAEKEKLLTLQRMGEFLLNYVKLLDIENHSHTAPASCTIRGIVMMQRIVETATVSTA